MVNVTHTMECFTNAWDLFSTDLQDFRPETLGKYLPRLVILMMGPGGYYPSVVGFIENVLS